MQSSSRRGPPRWMPTYHESPGSSLRPRAPKCQKQVRFVLDGVLQLYHPCHTVCDITPDASVYPHHPFQHDHQPQSRPLPNSFEGNNGIPHLELLCGDFEHGMVQRPTRKIDGQPRRAPIDSSWHVLPQSIAKTWDGRTYRPRDSHNGDHDRHKDDLLLCRSISNKRLRWDISAHPSTALFALDLYSSLMRARPVLGLNAWTAYIHFNDPQLSLVEQSFGPVVVRTAGPQQPITLGHLLHAIYVYFNHDISYDQVQTSPPLRYLLKSPRWQNIGRTPYTSRHGPKRLDILNGFSRFVRLRLDRIDRRSSQCHLVLELE